MGKLTLRQTDIIVITRTVQSDGSMSLAYLPFTVNMSLAVVIWLIEAIASALVEIDNAVYAVCRFLFTGWIDDLRLVWQALNTPLTWEVLRGT